LGEKVVDEVGDGGDVPPSQGSVRELASAPARVLDRQVQMRDEPMTSISEFFRMTFQPQNLSSPFA